MERGLLWLPLLLLFSWLAWAGWNEYQKIEAYRVWAQGFERSKYDIYAVLGQKNLDLTWGKPTRDRPRELQTFSLTTVASISLLVNHQPVNLDALPSRGDAEIEFNFYQKPKTVRIPFTDISLAREWTEYLQTQIRTF